MAALAAGRKRWLARLEAAGQKAPCGRKKGVRGRTRSRDKTVARAQRALKDVAVATDQNRNMVAPARAWGDMTPAEQLAHNARLSLDVTRRILELGVDPNDVKLLAQVKDVALAILSQQIRLDAERLRSVRDGGGGLEELYARSEKDLP